MFVIIAQVLHSNLHLVSLSKIEVDWVASVCSSDQLLGKLFIHSLAAETVTRSRHRAKTNHRIRRRLWLITYYI